MHPGRPGATHRIRMQTRTFANSFGVLAVLAAAAIALPPSASAITTELVHNGLNRPIFAQGIHYPGVGKLLYVVSQTGLIQVSVDEGPLTTFLDIDALVTNVSGNDERGLLGFALHPDFINNGYFFVYYTATVGGATNVVRYTIDGGDPTLADDTSAATIITVTQPFSNHNGGWIGFSPVDGYLYVSLGDGGSAGDPGNRAQNINLLLGKMLRLDVDSGLPYSVPADNPFVGTAGLDEIWSYGLRNAWRNSFDRQTGDLWIADVGQGDWEEVDFEAAGDGGHNYGWRLLEGFECYNPTSNCDPTGMTTLPIHVYDHPTGFSISGGYVYRGEKIEAIKGHYFFADFLTNRIWSLTYDGVNVVVTVRTAELAPTSGSITSIASFGEDADGELLICDRGGATTGEIWRIVAETSDVPEIDGTSALRLHLESANPFRNQVDFRLTTLSPDPIEARVISAHGAVVRTLTPGPATAGETRFSWDGHDADGHPAASGVYFVQTTQGSHVLTRRVDLLR